MSIIKQLWLAILFLLLSALLLSTAISLWSAKGYLQQQLQLKNSDNASSLALSMSQLAKDPVTLELLLMAQFDAGHYQNISLLDTDGQLIFQRRAPAGESEGVPDWFANMFSLDVQPGIGFVQDGWQQYGTLTVESHIGFALSSLWHSSRTLLWAFVLLLVVAGLLGTALVRWLLKPLSVAVEQAEAIGQRRFVLVKEPKTQEFKQLVASMNRLSSRMRLGFQQDQAQLHKLQQKLWFDDLTGLSNREYFFQQFARFMADEQSVKAGVLLICRVENLLHLNQQLGRAQADALLMTLANIMKQTHGCFSITGRLNGSDLVLLLADNANTKPALASVVQAIANLVDESESFGLSLPVASCEFDVSWQRGQLLSQLDQSLAQAALQGAKGWDHHGIQAKPEQENIQALKPGLMAAIQHGLTMQTSLVRSANHSVIQHRLTVELQVNDKLYGYQECLPWLSRLGLLVEFELALLDQALLRANKQVSPLVVPISMDCLLDAGFVSRLLQNLAAHKSVCRYLAIECSELALVRHGQELRALAELLKNMGCQFGLCQVGYELASIPDLLDLGLDYLVMDASLHQNLDQSEQQTVVQQICTLGNRLHVPVLAKVEQGGELGIKLRALGVAGIIDISR